MTTRFDEDDLDGPEFSPDDPLAVILRPPTDRLAPPSGHYETLRRRASRRRLVRTAAGVGVTCAVAAALLIALPLGRSDTPTTPAPPLAPPPASDVTTPPAQTSPTPSPSASPTRTTPPAPSRTPGPGATAIPTAVPTTARTPVPTEPPPAR
ncbi:hypothetical protein GCM10018780_35640 [Streptomyces lanatus]|nr:hypothetical protein GCM10018780_35640 [Streptomyces lanatus]